MTTPHIVPWRRVFSWVLRIALFALGLYFIQDSIRTGAYRELRNSPAWADGNLLGILVDLIISGVGAGVLLLILGVVAGPVARHRLGWVILGLIMLGAMAPFAGFGLIFGPVGGDQRTALGGLGFLLILCGTLVFFGGYVWAVVLGIGVLVKERRDRRSQRTLTAHTRAPY